MKAKRFYALSFAAMFLFAVFSVGGCGNSSSDLAEPLDYNTPAAPNNSTDTPTTPDNTAD